MNCMCFLSFKTDVVGSANDKLIVSIFNLQILFTKITFK